MTMAGESSDLLVKSGGTLPLLNNAYLYIQKRPESVMKTSLGQSSTWAILETVKLRSLLSPPLWNQAKKFVQRYCNCTVILYTAVLTDKHLPDAIVYYYSQIDLNWYFINIRICPKTYRSSCAYDLLEVGIHSRQDIKIYNYDMFYSLCKVKVDDNFRIFSFKIVRMQDNIGD